MIKNSWELEYNDFDKSKEKSREALLTVGNGYLGTRGSLDENLSGEISYPGTYISGLYNKLVSKVAGKDIYNEDFVNCPNWIYTTFKINNENWFNFSNVEIVSINRKLDFKNGQLSRQLIIKDNKGRKTKILSYRFASMHNQHLVALKYEVCPLNYSGKITIRTGLKGNIINEGVERYKQLNQKHLVPIDQTVDKNILSLLVKTTQSNIEIAQSSKIDFFLNSELITDKAKYITSDGEVYAEFSNYVEKNNTFKIQKVTGIFTSKNDDVNNPLIKSKKFVDNKDIYEELLHKSQKEWDKLWNKFDIIIEGDDHSQMLIRMHIFHLLATSSHHNANIDFGIPARGLHGEAYRGHIFWDELYVLPLYYLHLPDTAKSILKYRYNRLDKAREYAKKHGYKGAMFPWQSGSEGIEETQIIHLNPISGEWGDDYSSLQRHISIAVAYNVWCYYHYTNDYEFLKDFGAEIFFEICRFWASKAVLNDEGKYDISKVMGPDEFHEKLPEANEGGLKNNAYTNILVAWLFIKANEIYELLGKKNENILKKIRLNISEISKWNEISIKLNIGINNDGILAQFNGYFKLKELDWEYYKNKYDNIHRMDRVLKAEGESPDDYKVAKQADVLMIFYLLPEIEVSNIITKLGHKITDDYLEKNYEYYLKRTSHGSTLSRVVHAFVARLLNKKDTAWNFYIEALESDYTDIQGGTTAEGIHAGVMGGTVLALITSFAGINFLSNHLIINPCLPEKWRKIKFNFLFRNYFYNIEIDKSKIYIFVENTENKEVKIEINKNLIQIKTNINVEIEY